MGKRGPPAGSASAKRCASNRKKPGAATVGPVKPGHRPTKPGHLTGVASNEWDRIVPELVVAGTVELVDRAALASYCQAWAELVETTAEVEKYGRLVEEPIQNAAGEIIGQRLKANPAVRMQRDALNRVKQFAGEFGLSPASRVRLTGEAAKAKATEEKVDRLKGIKDRVDSARQKTGRNS